MGTKLGGSTERPLALGYTRVSTDEQVRDGVSLDVQRTRIEAYAVAKGLQLTNVLTDEGCSGKSMERPGIKELLKQCQQGTVANVIVWKLDRLTRRTRHLLSLVEDIFLARNVELHSVSESLDTSTPHGRFVLTLFGGLAQMERELIGERTKAALAYKRERGQPTSHPPLGFASNGSKKRMDMIPEELAIVRRILDLRQRGRSYRMIARQLNSQGVPTKRGRRWASETVRKVVQRRSWYASVLKAHLDFR